MRTNREEIQYHNRKFKVNLTLFNAEGEFSARLDPPNETGFSDRYSQCLIKINKARATNAADTITFGMDSVWWGVGGAGVTSHAGIYLQSNMVSNNCLTVSDQQVRRGVSCLLTGTSAFSNNVFDGLAMGGASEVIRGGAAGTDTNIHKVNEWLFEDNRSIEDAGILCGNPFGHDITFNFRIADALPALEKAYLTSASNPDNAAQNGSTINVELEILMLPNPVAGE